MWTRYEKVGDPDDRDRERERDMDKVTGDTKI